MGHSPGHVGCCCDVLRQPWLEKPGGGGPGDLPLRAPLIPSPGWDREDPIYNENGPFLLLLDCFSATAIVVPIGSFGSFDTLGDPFPRGPQGLVPSTSGIISPALVRVQVMSVVAVMFSGSVGGASTFECSGFVKVLRRSCRVVTCVAIESSCSRSVSSSSNHIWKECARPGLGYWRCGISYGWNLTTCSSRYRNLAPPFASVRDAAGTLPGPRRAANRMEVTWLNCATIYNPA